MNQGDHCTEYESIKIIFLLKELWKSMEFIFGRILFRKYEKYEEFFIDHVFSIKSKKVILCAVFNDSE